MYVKSEPDHVELRFQVEVLHCRPTVHSSTCIGKGLHNPIQKTNHAQTLKPESKKELVPSPKSEINKQ